jgi:chorismate mutase
MQRLIEPNKLQPERVVSATFTATGDLDALFPASVARRLSGWDGVALLDMGQLAMRGDPPRCIRVLLLAWLPADQIPQQV